MEAPEKAGAVRPTDEGDQPCTQDLVQKTAHLLQVTPPLPLPATDAGALAVLPGVSLFLTDDLARLGLSGLR